LSPACARLAATLALPFRPLLRFAHGRRRLTLIAAGGAMVIAAGLGVGVSVVSGRTTPPTYTPGGARAGGGGGRGGGAPPEGARARLDRGLEESGRKDDRVFFRRDFTVAKSLLETTEGRGQAAENEARDRRNQMTLRAQTLLGRATEMVEISRAFASMIPLQ